MPKKTLQETYDFMVDNIVKQGHRAVDEEGSCMYLAPDGSRCAVGWLVEDKATAMEMNARGSVSYLNATHIRALHEVWGGDLDLYEFEMFISRMQRAHDELDDHKSFVENFVIAAKNVGHDYGLTV